MAARITNARRRIAALVALVVTGGLPLVTLGATPAGASVSVSTEAEIRAAFNSGADATIDLTADIVLDDCTGPVLWNVDSDLTVNGNGHTLSVSPTCSGTPHRVIQFADGNHDCAVTGDALCELSRITVTARYASRKHVRVARVAEPNASTVAEPDAARRSNTMNE